MNKKLQKVVIKNEKAVVTFEETETQFKILAENLPNILFINVEGRVVYTNSISEKILGFTKKEIYSETFNFLNITAPESIELVKKNFKLHMSGKEIEPYEYSMITKSGQILHTVLYSKLIIYQGKRAILGTILDITRQKQAEEKLMVLEKRKDEFITIASHEMKTPITSLKLISQILLRKSNHPDPLLLKMHDQVEKLTRLVDQLLDVSKIQSGNIQLIKDRFLFPELIAETADMIQAFSPDHKISFVNKDVKKVYADKGRIEQVLINLISNAVKYSPAGSKIIIASKKNGNEIIVSVKDYGIGIQEDHIKKIFERFYRTTAAGQNKLPGLGMGLYISFEIIKLHEGKMWVKSKNGTGSTFYFSLPRISAK